MPYKKFFYVQFGNHLAAGDVSEYFIRNSNNFFLLSLAPHFIESMKNTLFFYKNGKKKLQIDLPSLKGPKFIKKIPLKLTFSYFLYIYVFFRYVKPRDLTVLCCHPLYLIGSLSFSKIFKTRFVYWIWDYFLIKNNFFYIFNKISFFYNSRLPFVLYLSKRLANIYNSSSFKGIHKVVGFGIKKKVEARNRRLKENNILGFVGTINHDQGLEIIFEFLQKENYKLEIIGESCKRSYYENLAKKMGIFKKIKFLGFIEKDEDVLMITKNWFVALALYKPTVSNPAKYTEPGKVKFCLGFGLPIITTNVSEIHQEVKNLHAGVIVGFSAKEMSTGISEIRKNKDLYIKGVNDFVDKYEFNSYYKEKFNFLESM